MKKILFIAVALIMKTTLFAQEPAKFGAKLGVNLAKLDVEGVNSSDIDFRTSVHAGALAHIHLSPQWALQPELMYSGQGMNQKFSGETYTWKLDYLTVPVMIQYMFNNGFRVEAGPQLGLLLSAKMDDDETLKDDLKTTDISLGFGLSYLSHSGLGVGARYNHGLNSINDDGVNEIKNRVIQIGLFYLFDHQHKVRSR